MKYEIVKLDNSDTCTESIPALISKLEKAKKKSSTLLLDMKNVTLINSGGIGVLIRTHKDLQVAGGGIVIANPAETALAMLENSGLSGIVKTYDTLADAKKALDNKQA